MLPTPADAQQSGSGSRFGVGGAISAPASHWMTWHIDRHLVKWVKWVKWKYKKKGQYTKRARRWLGQVAKHQPELFAHWRLGAPFPAE